MRLKNKVTAWLAVGAVGIGSMNVSARNIGVVEAETAVLRKLDSKTIQLKAGDRMEMTLDDNFRTSDYVKVDVNGTNGYVEKKAVRMEEIETNVLVNGAKIRKEPSSNSEVVATLNKGRSVTAFYKYQGWYAVDSGSGEKGFIYEDQVDEEYLYLLDRKTKQQVDELLKQKPAVDEAIIEAAMRLKKIKTTVMQDNVKLRKEPSPDAEVIAVLNKNVSVTAYYKYSSWYAAESTGGKKGFVYESQIADDYLYVLDRKDEQQLNSLLGKNTWQEEEEKPSPGAVEVITWSKASKLLPRGGTAVIEDVYTGKRFAIKRTYGTNHADVETLTAADTVVMKEVWGGFNWQRRPVIVHIAGRRLAASMAGMPHAGKDSAPNLSYTSGLSAGYGYGQNLDAVKGNEMSGVCDLHFRGSTKHADGKITATVDPLHQAAISIAAKYK